MAVQLSKGDKTALIIGASGLVGSFCLEQLLLSPNYARVLSFGRRKLPIKNAKLQQYIIDFDQPQQYTAYFQGDDFYCCLGTTIKKAGSQEAFQKVDYTYIYELAKIAAHNKVNQFLLVSAIGADPNSLIFYNRVKGKTEEAIRNLPFWAVHIFRPSVLLGQRNENRWGERAASIIGKGIDYFTGGLLGKYSPVEGEVVAKAMLNAAQRLEGGIHTYYYKQMEPLANPRQLDSPS
ncbi:MAG: oxidoreductase [Bacteroidota bacterium]